MLTEQVTPHVYIPPYILLQLINGTDDMRLVLFFCPGTLSEIPKFLTSVPCFPTAKFRSCML